MEARTTVPRIDLNRGLRDRLGRVETAGRSVRQAELTLAVNDLQDLVRSRFATQPADLQR